MDNYVKNIWQAGNLITSVKLNHMEDGIATIEEKIGTGNSISIVALQDILAKAISAQGLKFTDIRYVSFIMDENYDLSTTTDINTLILSDVHESNNQMIVTYRNHLLKINNTDGLNVASAELVFTFNSDGSLKTIVANTMSSSQSGSSSGQVEIYPGTMNY